MRIVKARYKVLYWLCWVVVSLLAAPQQWGGSWTVASIFMGNAIFLAFLVIGVRSFRGVGEPIQPKRAWWRLTSRPTAGFVIAGVSASFSIVYATRLILRPVGEALGTLDTTINVVLTFGVAIAFLNSSVRLLRAKSTALTQNSPTR